MAKCLVRIVSELNHKFRSVAVVEEHSSPIANLKGFFPKVPVTSEDKYYKKKFRVLGRWISH